MEGATGFAGRHRAANADVDPAAVTEPERFVACLRAGWDEVLAVAPEA